jgi:hypothetical protein
MASVKVESMDWSVWHVASFASEAEFTAHYMADADVYPRKANKADVLALVYKACVPEKPKAAAKPKKSEAETEVKE